MQESNQTICKSCNTIKTRIAHGKYEKKGKRFINEAGKQWSGMQCPDCVRERMKEYMRLKRSLNKVKTETPDGTT